MGLGLGLGVSRPVRWSVVPPHHGCKARKHICQDRCGRITDFLLPLHYCASRIMSSFPKVQGGGSLLLAWQIKHKRVLVVGGGEVCWRLHLYAKLRGQVAAGRILNVLNADAKVTVVSPRDGLNPEVAYRIERGQVDYVDRVFEPSDLDGVDMVLTAIDDPEASSRIWKLCKERKLVANIADVPPECDFYFGSVHRDGPLQVMVSTNGNGPRLAAAARKQIARSLPPNTGAAIEKVGRLRKRLRRIAPGPDEGPKRMQWWVGDHSCTSPELIQECRMSSVCDEWSLEDLTDMRDEDMDVLLRSYKPNAVPSLKEVRGEPEEPIYVFDGSFGWM